MVHLKSLDWRVRRARHAGKVPPKIVSEVIEIVKDILEGQA